MDIRNRRAIRARASEALAANPGDPSLTVLVYAAIMAGSALLVTALTTVLDNQIAGTGGLSNLGTRSILSAIRRFLPLVQSIVLLGLEFGYRGATVRMARRQAVAPRTLLMGFPRFAALLRSLLLRGLLYSLLAMGCMYASTFVFMLSPLSGDLFALLEPMLTDPEALYNALYTDAAFLEQAYRAMLPVVPIFLVLFLAVAAPFFYQYRMTAYCLLEEPRRGAMAAMRESAQMMKHNRVSMLKLDLGFWWFYLAQGLVAAVMYGDVLLSLAGVALPWSETVSFYVFYVLALVLEAVLFCLFLNRVETTYATVYETLRPKPQPSQGGAVLGNIFDLAKDHREDQV